MKLIDGPFITFVAGLACAVLMQPLVGAFISGFSIYWWITRK